MLSNVPTSGGLGCTGWYGQTLRVWHQNIGEGSWRVPRQVSDRVLLGSSRADGAVWGWFVFTARLSSKAIHCWLLEFSLLKAIPSSPCQVYHRNLAYRNNSRRCFVSLGTLEVTLPIVSNGDLLNISKRYWRQLSLEVSALPSLRGEPCIYGQLEQMQM